MEDKTKNEWLKRLKSIDPNWRDGDLNNKDKTADLVNDKLKLAIELKNDTVSPNHINTLDFGLDLVKLSDRYRSYAKDANKKLRFYPSYKTALLIECGLIKGILEEIFTGIETKKGKTGQFFLKNKNLREKYSNIGCYLINSNIKDCIAEFYYFRNPTAKNDIILGKTEIEKNLGIVVSLLLIRNKRTIKYKRTIR